MASSRLKAIRIGRSLTEIIRNMKRTSGSVWVEKVRSRSGFDISPLVGEMGGLSLSVLYPN